MNEGADPYRYDWEFQRATGMVAVQTNNPDMDEAGRRLIALAAEVGESVHDTALMILDRRLRMS